MMAMNCAIKVSGLRVLVLISGTIGEVPRRMYESRSVYKLVAFRSPLAGYTRITVMVYGRIALYGWYLHTIKLRGRIFIAP